MSGADDAGSGPDVPPGDRRAVLVELRRALRAEFGARSLYGWLARLHRSPELRRLMGGLEDEEREQIARLRSLMTDLGERPRARSFRRRVASACLAFSTPVFGVRPVLRLCEEAEGTASRWYAHFGEHFARSGELEAARVCSTLALTKSMHVQALRAWVNNAPRR